MILFWVIVGYIVGYLGGLLIYILIMSVVCELGMRERKTLEETAREKGEGGTNGCN